MHARGRRAWGILYQTESAVKVVVYLSRNPEESNQFQSMKDPGGNLIINEINHSNAKLSIILDPNL